MAEPNGKAPQYDDQPANNDSNGGFITEDGPSRQARHPRSAAAQVQSKPDGALIKVEPLRKDQMQPSYAQDLGVGEIVRPLRLARSRTVSR